MNHHHFHIMYYPSSKLWPDGGYSLYRIKGDEIARRIAFDGTGKVIRRDPWPGYIGTYVTMAEVTSEIEAMTALVC